MNCLGNEVRTKKFQAKGPASNLCLAINFRSFTTIVSKPTGSHGTVGTTGL